MPTPAHHTLNDGTTLPLIGLGTYALRGMSGAEAMAAALDNGYRLLDSAVNYENEGAVGNALRRSSFCLTSWRSASLSGISCTPRRSCEGKLAKRFRDIYGWGGVLRGEINEVNRIMGAAYVSLQALAVGV